MTVTGALTTIAKVVKIACLTYGTQGFILPSDDGQHPVRKRCLSVTACSLKEFETILKGISEGQAVVKYITHNGNSMSIAIPPNFLLISRFFFLNPKCINYKTVETLSFALEMEVFIFRLGP